MKRVFRCRVLKIFAKLTHKVGEIDKPNLTATLEMVMNFCNRRDAHGGVLMRSSRPQIPSPVVGHVADPQLR